MSFDIGLSDVTDLIVTGARDLAGVSGDALIEQRIKTRLKIERGSWILDEAGSLGSMIHSYLGNPVERFVERLPDVIRAALSEMDEIQIHEIRITDNDQSDPTWNTSQVLAVISWSHLPDLDSGEVDPLTGQTVIVPIGIGAGRSE